MHKPLLSCCFLEGELSSWGTGGRENCLPQYTVLDYLCLHNICQLSVPLKEEERKEKEEEEEVE